MSRVWRRVKIVVAALLAFAVGSVPACGTMGGGGMKYLWEPPSYEQNHVKDLGKVEGGKLTDTAGRSQ